MCLTTEDCLDPSFRCSLQQHSQTSFQDGLGLCRAKEEASRSLKASSGYWHSLTSAALARASPGPAQGEAG